MVREGYLPTVSLRVQMRVIKEAESITLEEHDSRLLPVIDAAFDNSSFDEEALADLLQLLVDGVHVSPYFVDRVVHLFLAKRPADLQLSAQTVSIIVRTHVRAGDTEAAARWSADRLPPLLQASSRRGRINPVPYTTLLRQLAHAKPTDQLYNWALSEIESSNPSIRIDLPFLNAVLAHAFGQRDFDAFFSLYAHMVQERTPALTPDGYTFSTLFRAVHQLTCNHSRRSKRMRGMKPPDNIPSPRSVFRDMLTCLPVHPSRTSTAVLDSPALRKAVRAFMGQFDYPAALVAVRLFRTHPALLGPPTFSLYRIIVNSLLSRIRHHLPRILLSSDPNRLWAYRFLGLGDIPAAARAHVKFDIEMVHRVLLGGIRALSPTAGPQWIPVPAYSSHREIPLEGPGELPPQALHVPSQDVFEVNGMPTALQLAGLEPVEADRPFAVAPLERLLVRAMLAQSFAHDPEGLVERTPAEAFAHALGEMVPKPMEESTRREEK